MVRSPADNDAPSLTLPVAEALPKDVGRGIARLDPDSMERLGASIGDVVAITGQRAAALKVMPGLPGRPREGTGPDRRDRARERRDGA